MTYVSRLGERDRRRVDEALPQVLRAGEAPRYVATCTHVRRTQQFLVITDQRLIGLSLDGKLKVEVHLSEVAGYQVTEWSTLAVETPGGVLKLGTLVGKDTKDVKQLLEESIGGRAQPRPSPDPGPALNQPGQSGPAPEAAFSPPVAYPTPPPNAAEGTLADQLTRIAQLHAQGALSAAEFTAAKEGILGRPVHQAPAPPSPVVPHGPPATSGRRTKVKEMERTCSLDGCVWFVPLELTKVRKPTRGLGLVEFGEVMLGMGGAGSQQLTREQAAWARAQAARQCPRCGSQAFSERVVRH